MGPQAVRPRTRATTGLGGEQVEGRQAVRELLLANRRRDWATFWRIVDERLATGPAELDLQRAAGLAREAPSCLLCFEADHVHCHRRRVAELLEARWGFEPRHLAVPLA